MRSKAWFHGLVAATILGMSNAGVLLIADPLHFNFNEWHQLLKVSFVSGVFGALCYLKQSPLPRPDDEPEPPPQVPTLKS